MGNIPKPMHALGSTDIHPKNPADIEEALLQEFNLHKDPIVPISNLNNTTAVIDQQQIHNNAIQATQQVNRQYIKQTYNNLNQTDVNKVRDSVTNSLNMQIKEGEFLQSILESDKQIFESLLEDIEKINKQISTVAEKNKYLKDQILEYRRKINMEKDNLVKAANKLYAQSNELMNTKGKIKFNFR